MREGSDGLNFGRYLWRRWYVTAIACVTALAVTGAVSVLLPARYTATATVLIDLPGGSDPRSSIALSPVYLESLKTYERLAASDTLFSRALDDLHLRERYPGASFESLKRRMLTVTRATNTTFIDISATLNDPREAQALAQYIAEHTVQTNTSLDQQSNQEISLEPQQIFDAAKARLDKAEKVRNDFASTTFVDTLEKQVANAVELRTEVGKDLGRARAELANYLGQQQSPQPVDINERQPGWTQLEIGATRARIQDLENQDRQLLQFLDQKGSSLEALKQKRESLDSELKLARADEEGSKAKLSEVLATAALRGVRLRVLDPGIVPQRPSFPNTPLNLMIALVLSLIAAVVYLAIQFAYGVQSVRSEHAYSLR